MIGRVDKDNLSFISDVGCKKKLIEILNSSYFEKKEIKLTELNDQLNDLL
jgi:hypothetical protein